MKTAELQVYRSQIKEKFKNKSLIHLINKDFESHPDYPVSPPKISFSEIASLEDELWISLNSNRYSHRSLACIESLGDFILEFHPSEIKNTIKMITEMDIQKLEYLFKDSFTEFVHEFYSDIDPHSNPLKDFYWKRKSWNVWYEAFDIAYKALGFISSVKLVNGFLEGLYSGRYNNSKILLEIFLEALDYCMKNSDYPIEWLLEQAFVNSIELRLDEEIIEVGSD